MKRLTCEMCGSTDLIKQDGVFVCQTCGCKYSVEEAKKMMIEGTVDVSGSTVKVDSSEELNNLYQIARRARDNNNSENAAKYYDMILVKDPTSWEASFYVVYFKAMECKIAQIQSAATSVTNCLNAALKLIKDHVSDYDEQVKAVKEIELRCERISGMLFNGAVNHYRGIGYEIQSQYTPELLMNCSASSGITLYLGEYIDRTFPDYPELSTVIVSAWRNSISKEQESLKYCPKTKGYKDIRASTENLIMQYEQKSRRVLKEGVKRQQEKRERQRKERIATYWSEHKEDKERLEKEREGLERQMDSLSAQIKAIEEKIAPKLKELQAEKDEKTPFELRVNRQTRLIRSLQSQYDNCGRFKGKEKKAIQERIDSQEKPKLERMKKQAESERKLLNDKVDAEINDVRAESVRLHEELSSLQKKRDSITGELTKDR